MSSRVAVITGAAGGIGRAVATLFRRNDWSVVELDREQGDLADRGSVDEIFKSIELRFARIDALVNNAAVQTLGSLVDTEPEDWDSLMAVNLRGPYLAVRRAYPLLRVPHGAAIVNVASVHALATSAGIAAYASSKGGVVAMTRALAVELARDQIRVNAVLPGAVDTSMLQEGLARQGSDVEAARRALAARTPLGRIGTPEEIAEAVYFLADGKLSSFITGQTLVVDGGALARLGTE